MFKLLIFGGTTEGRKLAVFCNENKINAEISVATEYGAELIPSTDYVKVHCGRLDCGQIIQLLKENKYAAVIDSTHPYAVEVTRNIRQASEAVNIPCYRLLRKSENTLSGTVVQDMDELVELLNKNDKNILCTLGSKELPKLTAVVNYKKRMWIRVLPAETITEYCTSLGFDENRIILGKGPFSVEDNIRHLKLCGGQLLITKESGAVGGYPEKVRSAEICGAELITVKRPSEEGFSLSEIKKIIIEKSGEEI